MPMIYQQAPGVAAVRHVREHVLWLRFSANWDRSAAGQPPQPIAPLS
ncbi:MAG: hypothetical protein ACM37U_09860 [Gemmatimonas sp.]|nr:hypothetical protein [Gemmatimonadaceae bacterium]